MLQSHADFLRIIKLLANTRTYLEIGVESGYTLFAEPIPDVALGVDPACSPAVPETPGKTIALFPMTSDVFFDDQAVRSVTQEPIDVTFVDGLHWAEYALRDVLNAERLSHPGSVILLHDIYPKSSAEAGRTQVQGFWMGDVFKTAAALRRFRPDLRVDLVGDLPPSGMAVVTGVDPSFRLSAPALDEMYAFMADLSYEADFHALIGSSLIGVGSPAFIELLDRVAKLPKRDGSERQAVA